MFFASMAGADCAGVTRGQRGRCLDAGIGVELSTLRSSR
jgi:hypothetical protein